MMMCRNIKGAVVKVFSVFMIVFMLMVCFTTVANAESNNEDYIHEYDIVVDIRQDGTMDITYELDWEVLKNGPVTWVKVGIPNYHVDQIAALTDNISKAEYYSDNGGAYVRVDFNEKYNPGDIINFKFSIHQSWMYSLKESGKVTYSFTPGWYDKIEIGKLQVEWYVKDGYEIVSTNANEKITSAYIWSYSDLKEGEKVTANISYSKSKSLFEGLNEDEQYVEGAKPLDGGDIFLIVVIIIVVIFVVLFVVALIADDTYGGGGSSVWISGGGGGRSGGCASSCACACACACAGGGRAGCSTKGFYEHEAMFNKKDFDNAIEKLKK